MNPDLSDWTAQQATEAKARTFALNATGLLVTTLNLAVLAVGIPLTVYLWSLV